ncbi:hypothetical protein DF141_21285 [Burkholderia cenocepacia]|nr:hypothetical protein DF147_30145 [Burkholderia cenocepacia]RQU72000.1 hypothetical protein DF141_21285 [Burkholderia cenocepacia]RQU83365.1 hypothetical protein DF133_31370 [Burkholderia cenocepacia]RQV10276.1 hypothetical protein DF039_27570 [Burkholderia cenocepacia]RQV13587.1 hypothetical protein DF132_33160 [Burkholderia cenocepacia]
MESHAFCPSGAKITQIWLLKMQTAFRHMLSGLISGVVLLFVTGPLYACDSVESLPGQNFDLMFAQNSAAVSVEQAKRLEAWVSKMLSQFPVREGVAVSGVAESAEIEPDELSVRRAESAQRLLMHFGLKQERYAVHSYVYQRMSIQDNENAKRAEITLLPGCSDHCCINR